MLLKRVYDTSGPQPRLVGVKLLRAGPRQRFSPRIIAQGIAQNWLSMGDGKITLRTDPPATYSIVRGPGYYCVHCGNPMADGPSGAAHVKTDHAGKVSPDPQNPAGFRRDNFYECVLAGSVEIKQPVGVIIMEKYNIVRHEKPGWFRKIFGGDK